MAAQDTLEKYLNYKHLGIFSFSEGVKDLL